MSQNVFITGTGREMALGFNFVRRCLERGDHVVAAVRKPSEAIQHLMEQYPDALRQVEIDIGSTPSVEAAAKKTAEFLPSVDLIINNAVMTSPDTNKPIQEANLDDVAAVFNVDAVGPLRVTKAFLPLLEKSDRVAFVANISSEAGSIEKCYRNFYIDYGMAKCALNMATVTMRNTFRDSKKINFISIHPGWMRTNPGNAAAPLEPYDAADMMLKLFEEKREDWDGHAFITSSGEDYPY